jgi:hypothetical protein
VNAFFILCNITDFILVTVIVKPTSNKVTNVKWGMIMKWLIHIIFTLLYLVVTFFGLGPVLLADGVMKERVIVAIIVAGTYCVLLLLHRFIIKRMKK